MEKIELNCTVEQFSKAFNTAVYRVLSNGYVIRKASDGHAAARESLNDLINAEALNVLSAFKQELTMSEHDEMVKLLIELAENDKEADSIIEKYTEHKRTEDKLNYVNSMFDVEVVHRTDSKDATPEQILYNDYMAILTVIVNKKWR